MRQRDRNSSADGNGDRIWGIPRMATRPVRLAAERQTAAIMPHQSSQAIDHHALSLGRLGELVGFHLRRAQDASFQAFARRVGNDNLKPGRFAVLALIGENQGVTPTGLSRMSGRDKSSITPALRDLESRGLLRRLPVPGDRRSCTLHLTAPGADALAGLMQQAEEHDRALRRLIGPDNLQVLLEQLRRIASGLDAEP
jgi:DNA-binding MarR family transcriptional regulator